MSINLKGKLPEGTSILEDISNVGVIMEMVIIA